MTIDDREDFITDDMTDAEQAVAYFRINSLLRSTRIVKKYVSAEELCFLICQYMQETTEEYPWIKTAEKTMRHIDGLTAYRTGISIKKDYSVKAIERDFRLVAEHVHKMFDRLDLEAIGAEFPLQYQRRMEL